MPRRTVKSILKAQSHVLNGYITMPGAFSAELFARQGWDAVTLDLQHGLIGYESALAILQAIAAVDVVPMVRLSWLEPGPIMKMLDAGVLGVTCPMVNTADDAERLVRYCKYPPRGERSSGPLRASLLDGDGYAAGANDAINVFAMIETEQGVRNAEQILAVEGIDGIYLGLADLALSMGKTPHAGAHDPMVERAVDHILELCAARGRIAGVQARTPEAAWRMVQRGFRFITLSSDARALSLQVRSWVTDFRRLSDA